MITNVVSQGEAYPLHSGCGDPCDFPKCRKLDCRIYGSGGLRLFSWKKGKKEIFSHHFIFLELKNLKVQSALLFVFLCVFFYNLVSGMLF